MKYPNSGFAAVLVLAPAIAALHACGGASSGSIDGGAGGASSGGGASGGSGGALFLDASTGGSSGGSSGGATATSANGMFTAPDCAGCTFPAPGAPACASSAPAIKIVYPNDGVLVPPNMNVIAVQWTPFGSGYSEYEVDFANSITDTRIITKCSAQTMDTGQPSAASGGCELDLTPQEWSLLSNANRGGAPVGITVRGTTDGKCATSSQSTVHLTFSEEDLLGAIYYWKSTVSANGTGGQIWEKSFGDTNPEQQVTGVSGALTATCNGCHALSRDGLRMVVYSDDDDSDDEYSDVTGSLIDMTTKQPIGTAYAGRNTGQPPGFSTFSPDHSLYLTSNGLGRAPTNNFALWSGNAGTQTSTITFGAAADRPTMPDWSPDGRSVVYALPNTVAAWDQGGGGGGGRGGVGGARNDDDHEFGGSLYTLPYNGSGAFGTPTVFLASKGENNYYPSYSPDGQYVVFDRAPQSTGVTAIDGCVGSSPQVACPNDSFSNPAARLMLMQSIVATTPLDLEKANGSPASSPVPLSNSWPRWSPFVQMYRGNRLLWVAFSSTRDYGVRVRNHRPGMYQCYPPDSYELAGGAHGSTFDPACQQPKLWMAAINLSEAKGTDPSFPAFFLPFQDITTHNHTPQWTQQVATTTPTGPCVMSGGNCLTDPSGCCSPLTCSGNGTCIAVIQ
jgi:Tol biopolymer transport system component